MYANKHMPAHIHMNTTTCQHIHIQTYTHSSMHTCINKQLMYKNTCTHIHSHPNINTHTSTQRVFSHHRPITLRLPLKWTRRIPRSIMKARLKPSAGSQLEHKEGLKSGLPSNYNLPLVLFFTKKTAQKTGNWLRQRENAPQKHTGFHA